MPELLTKQEKEIFQNIAETGIMHSLKALSKLSGKSWNVFSEECELIPFDKAGIMFPAKETARFGGDMSLEGDTPMTLLYIFPQESAINLTHFFTDPSCHHSREWTTLQMLAVAEVSNILANTFLNVIANTLQMRMLLTAPRVVVDSAGTIVDKALKRASLRPDYVFKVNLCLASECMSMCGVFAILLSKEALKILTTKIQSASAGSEKSRKFIR